MGAHGSMDAHGVMNMGGLICNSGMMRMGMLSNGADDAQWGDAVHRGCCAFTVDAHGGCCAFRMMCNGGMGHGVDGILLPQCRHILLVVYTVVFCE